MTSTSDLHDFARSIPGDPHARDAIRLICARFDLPYERVRQLMRQSSWPRKFRPRPLTKETT